MSKLLRYQKFLSVILAWDLAWKIAWVFAWNYFFNWIRPLVAKLPKTHPVVVGQVLAGLFATLSTELYECHFLFRLFCYLSCLWARLMVHYQKVLLTQWRPLLTSLGASQVGIKSSLAYSSNQRTISELSHPPWKVCSTCSICSNISWNSNP